MDIITNLSNTAAKNHFAASPKEFIFSWESIIVDKQVPRSWLKRSVNSNIINDLWLLFTSPVI